MTKTSKDRNIVFAIFGVYLLYFSQGILFKELPVVGQFLAVLILFIGIISTYKIIISKNFSSCPPAKWLFVFIIMLIVTYILSKSGVRTGRHIISTLGQFKGEMTFSLSFFIGIWLAKKRKIKNSWLSVICICLLVIAFADYILMVQDYSSFHVEVFTNNSAYSFVIVIPFVPFLIKSNKYIGFAVALIVIGMILTCAKRGAILCAGIAALVYLIEFFRGRKLTIRMFGLIICVIGVVTVFVIRQYESNAYLQERMEQTAEGNSSRRDIIYNRLLRKWERDHSITKVLLGNGTAASVEIAGNYAHNDWLELLADNGLLGVLLYLGLFISFFRYFNKKDVPRENRLIANIILSIWFAETLFSMGYTDMMNSFYMILLGIETARVKDIMTEINIDSRYSKIVAC